MVFARNRQYEFCVGTLETGPCEEGAIEKPPRWIGYAVGYTPGGTPTMFLFPEISEGGLAGITDRVRCIQMAAAIAQAPECGYGGVEEWEIEPGKRASPDDFRCGKCCELFCRGECEDPDGFAEDGFWEE